MAAEGQLASDLADEVARASAQEQANADNIAAALQHALAAEGVLTADLATEVSRATGEESAIKTRLDNIEALLRHFFVDDAIL